MQTIGSEEKCGFQGKEEALPYDLILSDDKMEARLEWDAATGFRSFDEQEVRDYLEDLGIIGVESDALGQFVERCAQGDQGRVVVVVAKGRPPINGVNGRIEWGPSLKSHMAPEDIGDERIDWREQRKYSTVSEGEVLATIVPPTSGTDGVDVRGNPVPVRIKHGKARSLNAGPNVALGKDGLSLIATVGGRPLVDGSRVRVEPILEVNGDVDLGTGNIDLDGALIIRGAVRENFKVRAAGSIEVGGCIEAADVSAGGDLTVRGGITAAGRGTVSVGGNLSANFLANVTLNCGGDATVVREIVNSQVEVSKRLIVRQKGILGGRVVACEGLECSALGSDAGVRTEIVTEPDSSIMERTIALEKELTQLIEEVQQIAGNIRSLQERMTSLSHQDREQLTELYFEADEKKARIKEIKEEIDSLVMELKKRAKAAVIRVRDRICPGVVVEIMGIRREVADEVRGPVLIRLNADKRGIVFVRKGGARKG